MADGKTVPVASLESVGTIQVQLGDLIEDVLSLSSDTIFEIDLTPNRGDCFSHLGIARELAVFTWQKISNRKFDLISNSKDNINDYIKVTNKLIIYTSVF